ncbi:MAG TPA: methyltransferase domain-containing protein [Bryobacteraceae bacterium]|jgi:trans-aconitate 2-methyltransferase|nr:methyltransferase domain-containing protein [Bryobacteraceae bacterium]
MPQWDADVYLRFANERTQPVLDLLHRIRIENPRRIVDLGCGPGNSTAELRRRWPSSTIVGLDNSPEMIDKARQAFPEGLWEVGDASQWHAREPFDLVFSNAMLQWVPDHAQLCPHLFRQVAPGGALAAQAPAHYDSPLHREIMDVSRDPTWSDRMVGARQALTKESPAFYYDVLQGEASRMDVWETIYHHVLSGPEAVLEWFRGTGLRPFLQALDSPEERQRFESLLVERYTTAYPRHSGGNILFPFRRLFFVAYR